MMAANCVACMTYPLFRLGLHGLRRKWLLLVLMLRESTHGMDEGGNKWFGGGNQSQANDRVDVVDGDDEGINGRLKQERENRWFALGNKAQNNIKYDKKQRVGNQIINWR